MKTTGWYNGYSWKERIAKFRKLQDAIACGEIPAPQGPCTLCGDPESPVEYHDEDYSHPYRWSEPAVFVLCRHCHVHKVHRRFARPSSWHAFLAHVRRGGYARDLKDPTIRREVDGYRRALEDGVALPALRVLREYRDPAGAEWFAALTVDPASLRSHQARPRP